MSENMKLNESSIRNEVDIKLYKTQQEREVMKETLVFSSDTSGQGTYTDNLCNQLTDPNLVQVNSVIMCLLL